MKFLLETVARERSQIAHADEDSIAAIAAVAASRSAAGGLFGAQPADDTIATLARLHMYSSFIYECHMHSP
jgi:hypothetical protein